MKENYLDAQILIVDDELDLIIMVKEILKDAGYQKIHTAQSSEDALLLIKSKKIDLAILDVMLGKDSGFKLIKSIKKQVDFPVLFLSAKGEDGDRLTGLELGADDYLVKPFLPTELLLRIRAILKRTYKATKKQAVLKCATIDFDTATVVKKDQILPLTAKEFAILEVLYRNGDKIVTIDALCLAVWGENPFGYENSLMAHIRRIREKIELAPSSPQSLLTVKGLGYKLVLGVDYD